MAVSPPFLWGAQYYRAPTPGPECWEADHGAMRALGFNSVKYWAQWGWAHRAPGAFDWSDLDRLMDLALAHDLAVHLNVIVDIPPPWLFRRYPDSLMIRIDGRSVEPEEVAHRPLGGSPGPCLNHPGARGERMAFFRAAAEHFRAHPALAAWDVWNEPELCFNQRAPANVGEMVCRCSHCLAGFRAWLRERHGSLARLNAVWGRRYADWDDVAPPRTGETLQDFVEWGLYRNDVMTGEARTRIAVVRAADPGHAVFLHTVPNTGQCFNTPGCATNDRALFASCDFVAASFNGDGLAVPHLTSWAAGRSVYNTESHLNHGSAFRHPRRLAESDVRREFLAQIGAGVRGFQCWQFRAETLGREAPAWGVVGPGGEERSATRALRAFWEKLRPHAERLALCPPPETHVGVWTSRANELFHFAVHRSLTPWVEAMFPWYRALYDANIPFRLVDEEQLAKGDLAGLRLLILPVPYYMTQPETEGLDRWVRAGGVAVCEAHLAGYDGTAGRHASAMPGGGLAERWGLREIEPCDVCHLELEAPVGAEAALPQRVSAGFSPAASRERIFPMTLSDGTEGWGAFRYAPLAGDGLERGGWVRPDETLLAVKKRGKGRLFYTGTQLGSAAGIRGDRTLVFWLEKALGAARVTSPLRGVVTDGSKIRLHELRGPDNIRYIVWVNAGPAAKVIFEESWQAQGVFSGAALTVNAGESIEIDEGHSELWHVVPNHPGGSTSGKDAEGRRS